MSIHSNWVIKNCKFAQALPIDPVDRQLEDEIFHRDLNHQTKAPATRETNFTAPNGEEFIAKSKMVNTADGGMNYVDIFHLKTNEKVKSYREHADTQMIIEWFLDDNFDKPVAMNLNGRWQNVRDSFDY